jgi:hypothetical protein
MPFSQPAVVTVPLGAIAGIVVSLLTTPQPSRVDGAAPATHG